MLEKIAECIPAASNILGPSQQPDESRRSIPGPPDRPKHDHKIAEFVRDQHRSNNEQIPGSDKNNLSGKEQVHCVVYCMWTARSSGLGPRFRSEYTLDYLICRPLLAIEQRQKRLVWPLTLRKYLNNSVIDTSTLPLGTTWPSTVVGLVAGWSDS